MQHDEAGGAHAEILLCTKPHRAMVAGVGKHSAFACYPTPSFCLDCQGQLSRNPPSFQAVAAPSIAQ
jgi:hypothetical protein